MSFDKGLPFFKSAFSEPDGTASSSRILIAMIITFVLGVGIMFATSVKKSTLTITDFDNFLGAGGTFIGIPHVALSMVSTK